MVCPSADGDRDARPVVRIRRNGPRAETALRSLSRSTRRVAVQDVRPGGRGGGAGGDPLSEVAGEGQELRHVGAEFGVPDVTMGAVQVLRLITDPGDRSSSTLPSAHPSTPSSPMATAGSPKRRSGRTAGSAWRPSKRRSDEPGNGTQKGKIAYLLSNPHNSTGAVHSLEVLTVVAELARRYGVCVVDNEIHASLVLPGAKFTPCLSGPAPRMPSHSCQRPRAGTPPESRRRSPSQGRWQPTSTGPPRSLPVPRAVSCPAAYCASDVGSATPPRRGAAPKNRWCTVGACG